MEAQIRTHFRPVGRPGDGDADAAANVVNQIPLGGMAFEAAGIDQNRPHQAQVGFAVDGL